MNLISNELRISVIPIILVLVRLKKWGWPSLLFACTPLKWLYAHKIHMLPNVLFRYIGVAMGFECKNHAKKSFFYNEGMANDNGIFSIHIKGDIEHNSYEACTMSSHTACNIQFDNIHVSSFITSKNGIDSNERKYGLFALISTKPCDAYHTMLYIFYFNFWVTCSYHESHVSISNEFSHKKICVIIQYNDRGCSF